MLGPLLLAACAQGADADGSSFALPNELLEISGLASASADSVFAHNDESGVVHEIALADGRVRRSFAIGDPAEQGDFEGIAADDGHIYLITSEGRMLVARIGEDGARVPFEAHDTGVGAACEIEGLSLAPEPGELLIVCKAMLRGGPRGRLVIYRWSAETRAPAGGPWREIDLAEALGADRNGFAPSGIEWLPSLAQILVVSARARMLLVLDENGGISATHRLAPARHPQAEGITVVGSNRLVIADEGGEGQPARLAVYPYPLSDTASQ